VKVAGLHVSGHELSGFAATEADAVDVVSGNVSTRLSTTLVRLTIPCSSTRALSTFAADSRAHAPLMTIRPVTAMEARLTIVQLNRAVEMSNSFHVESIPYHI